MEETPYMENQPIEGVPVLQIGERFLPLEPPVSAGYDNGIFWFIYEGSKKAKLSIDPIKWTETLEEVTE